MLPTESEIKYQIGQAFNALVTAIHKHNNSDEETRKAITLNSLVSLYASNAYIPSPAPRPPYARPGMG